LPTLDDFLQLYLLFYLLTKCTKSTFSEKTGYFGTYVPFGLFHLLKLEQACTSSKKVCAGLLMSVSVCCHFCTGISLL
jgi:hypothetical protein